jgi:hypothetical protein
MDMDDERVWECRFLLSLGGVDGRSGSLQVEGNGVGAVNSKDGGRDGVDDTSDGGDALLNNPDTPCCDGKEERRARVLAGEAIGEARGEAC